MKEQENIRQELREKQAENLLAQQGGVPQWELPPGYLKELTENVIKAEATEKKVGRVIVLSKYWQQAAAVVAIAIACWYWYPQNDSPPLADTGLDWSEISTEDLQAYVDSHIDDFDIALLAESATEDGSEVTPTPGTGISTEALEEYLEEEDWLEDLEVSELFEDNI